VAAHFKKETVGGQTVYDLTQPLGALRGARVGQAAGRPLSAS
jgi:hypothetical protein